ncbi:MAG: type II secretion system protein GspD [Verrucomicrobia bacterium]|nr:type II secretion system protein GspD [Verrucomicrobiota bacterium]
MKAVLFSLVCFLGVLNAEEPQHTINFQDVAASEFIRFVSRITHVNFIFNQKEMQFPVTLSTGKAVSNEQVLEALVQILQVNGYSVMEKDGYRVIVKTSELPKNPPPPPIIVEKPVAVVPVQPLAAAPEVHVAPVIQPVLVVPEEVQPEFLVHKLQYHSGAEIEETIKKITLDLHTKRDTPAKYLSALQSVQWVKATNSLVCSGDATALGQVKKLIESLDVPLRQVFIEVLVIETDVRNGSEFGLQWAAGGKYKDKLGFATGNFPAGGKSPFAFNFQQVNASTAPTGSDIPIGTGFDLGVIGDIIMHKGLSYLSLGTLVSALQRDGDSTIVLNQKIITQDNKNSTIFVGDNIPFTGSVVQTVGSGQQTTSNVEYRDIGVTLSITPRLGVDDVITLDLTQEITEALPTTMAPVANAQVGGIRTTKTNMMTHVHVPDQHFLVLSGMIRNSHRTEKSGIPCLGGIPFIGNLFSKTQKDDEKRNIIVFVRPLIIHSMEDFKKITQNQENLYRSQANPEAFDKGLDLAK